MKLRPEIQGLRAVAVLLVIAGHAFPGLFPAGFIGVDIFFLISGYVITSMLMRDVEKPLRAYFVDFYARRIRRIIPSAVVIILATVFTTIHILGFITGGDTARDGIWALFFLANYHFSTQAVDYFASATPLPMLQHYWSLALEEQFYLLWPAFFYFSYRVLKKPLHATVLIIVSSLSFYVINNGAENPKIYFSTLARFWELSLGALIALIARKFANNRLALVATLLSLVLGVEGDLIGKNLSQISSVVIAGIIVLFSTSSIPLLSSKVMIYLGNISYLLYLIHWPMLQIPRLYKGSEISLAFRVGMIVATIVLAALLHHTVERPIRYQSTLVKSPSKTFISILTSVTLAYVILRMVQ